MSKVPSHDPNGNLVRRAVELQPARPKLVKTPTLSSLNPVDRYSPIKDVELIRYAEGHNDPRQI